MRKIITTRRMAWAIVTPRGSIDAESVRLRRRDVGLTIYDEMVGNKVARVCITFNRTINRRSKVNG